MGKTNIVDQLACHYCAKIKTLDIAHMSAVSLRIYFTTIYTTDHYRYSLTASARLGASNALLIMKPKPTNFT